jgi:predicted nuclease of predicted toxin-antitoxin system
VITTAEAQLRTRDDSTQLQFAREQRRVIVTHDADFLRLANQGSEHCGIAYCRKGALSTGEIIRALILVHEVLGPDEMVGQVEFL